MPAIIDSAFYEVVMSDIEKKLQKRLFRFFSPKKLLKTNFKFCSLLNDCFNISIMVSWSCTSKGT